MVEIGYALASEEHGPRDLVRCARTAEEAGFSFAAVTDRYHPRTTRQGESSFVWTVIGAIAQATTSLRVMAAVTCPTVRMHPAIIAQAAATAAAMMPGRFTLGVGSGEFLNEHILGDRWPPAPIRTQMLVEAVAIIRALWQGGKTSYSGRFFTLDRARIFTLPKELPPIMFAAEGALSAGAAGRVGDGLVNPNKEAGLICRLFRENGGEGKPAYLLLPVSPAESEEAGLCTAYERWPTFGNTAGLNRIVPTPEQFEHLATMVSPEALARRVIAGPDPERYIKAVEEGVRAGYDHIALLPVGPEREASIRFFGHEILPHVR
ncbi:TIGR03557 family F420-dependent LLM class oxidoreductase [Methanoculleus sp. 7T]|uniref:TIGR03557 family F420-dependent LLM class oxidoreductase n=1 Tax=Methanoculleus sp. 7T TaxID=2937282 RepID=UPI0020BF9C00|nr:TIGR03557 family F420-dependent LLM class oxidoreductase [Methanoculleus sp. 7T]MCK8517858.1 TIGR03557 family F420-dependent LLM class oxidoreductase [Methanoculleus sp. 7T]